MSCDGGDEDYLVEDRWPRKCGDKKDNGDLMGRLCFQAKVARSRVSSSAFVPTDRVL